MKVNALPWSYSKLSLYEQCPLKAALSYPTEGPRPVYRQHPAAARGDAIHLELETWMKSSRLIDVPDIAKPFEPHLLELRKAKARTEEPWYFNSSWQTTSSRTARWLTMKLDVSAISPEDSAAATVVDYKTGRIYETHEDQGKLYALGTFQRYPAVTKVKVEFWYIDQSRIRDAGYARKRDAKPIRSDFERRLARMIDDDKCAPKPNPFCRWCQFSKEAGGPCPAA